MIRIPADILASMAGLAQAAYPEECCGILMGRRRDGEIEITESVAAENIADAGERRKRYSVDPLAILRADGAARAGGIEIIGFYHSHPDEAAIPSETDARLAWEAYVYVIVAAGAGEGAARAWRFVEGVAEEMEIGGA